VVPALSDDRKLEIEKILKLHTFFVHQGMKMMHTIFKQEKIIMKNLNALLKATCQHCKTCQSHKSPRHNRKSEYHIVHTPSFLTDFILVDITGKINSKNHKHYKVIVVDWLT
jgi:hypothetical protein